LSEIFSKNDETTKSHFLPKIIFSHDPTSSAKTVRAERRYFSQIAFFHKKDEFGEKRQIRENREKLVFSKMAETYRIMFSPKTIFSHIPHPAQQQSEPQIAIFHKLQFFTKVKFGKNRKIREN